jgi:CheY-like chemotaxis protein
MTLCILRIYDEVTRMESNLRCAGPRSNGHAVLRVLLVEDHADTAQSTAVLLGLYGYEVHVASDGPAALQAAHASQPDVVMLDIGLPKMDGYRLAQLLRTQSADKSKRPFLIAVTGYGREADQLRSREAGIDLHLVKPVEPEVLHGILTKFHSVLMSSDERSDTDSQPDTCCIALAGLGQTVCAGE